jgi:hypothetical protein
MVCPYDLSSANLNNTSTLSPTSMIEDAHFAPLKRIDLANSPTDAERIKVISNSDPLNQTCRSNDCDNTDTVQLRWLNSGHYALSGTY